MDIFNLSWPQFGKCAENTFKQLLDNTDFTDVTLACEDGKQINTHKVVLSSSSPIFNQILKHNSFQNPFIYLKGVKYSDLRAIIRFIYLGETQIEQDNLEVFLAVARDLEVKGLADNMFDENVLKNKEVTKGYNCDAIGTDFETTWKETEATNDLNNEFTADEKAKHVKDNFTTGSSLNQHMLTLNDDLDMKVEMRDDLEIKDCHVNGENKPNLINFDGKFECNLCDYVSVSSANLRRHERYKHTGKTKFNCEICDYKAGQSSDLKKHSFRKHSSF
eukprot:GFUD01045742.1.p1 GENE.GFUD01045742.1~~GFUD01045742.1.p1  ORF type:complete len:286 (-),score=64.42 GFUD01045742.1:38-865(-)